MQLLLGIGGYREDAVYRSTTAAILLYLAEHTIERATLAFLRKVRDEGSPADSTRGPGSAEDARGRGGRERARKRERDVMSDEKQRWHVRTGRTGTAILRISESRKRRIDLAE